VKARLLLLAAVTALAAAAPAAPAARAFRDCSPGGVPARCGSIAVPENPEQPSGRQIQLSVVVVPALLGPARPDAFTYLAGGPGGAATDAVPAVLTFWRDIHLRHDMLFVDQRGTGGSNDLECPDPGALMPTVAALHRYVDKCLATVGGDPVWYGTRVAMDDLDTVRAALGYRTLDVYGTSYGATAAQVFLAEHPRSVRTMILDGGTLLGVPFYSRFARNAQRALDLVAARCRADARCSRAFPHWRARLDRLVAAWNGSPVSVQGTRIDGNDLAGVVHTLLLAADSAAQIPYLVSRTAAGDYGPLARHLSPPGVTRQLMYWSVWCNEPWVGIDAKGPWHTLFDGYLANSLRTERLACSILPKRQEPPAAWRTPHSNVPLLALVGGADPQDPIGNLAGLRRALPRSRVVVVPGAGHAIGQYGCLGSLVARFVDRGGTGALDTSCTRTIRPPAFATAG
jgi:pimeloyl-ACP methyl ester carboxylesterase